MKYPLQKIESTGDSITRDKLEVSVFPKAEPYFQEINDSSRLDQVLKKPSPLTRQHYNHYNYITFNKFQNSEKISAILCSFRS